MYFHNKELTPNARTLRKNMTEQERKLWYCFLREYPVRFLRQKVVGSYILDFYCSRASLAIEIDGSQHYETTGQEKDEQRTEYLNSLGIRVLRFSNHDVNTNIDGVCTAIDTEIKRLLGADAPAPF